MLSFWGFLILLFLICFFRHFATPISVDYRICYEQSVRCQEEDHDNIYATTTDSKSKNILNDLQAYARNNGTVDSFEGNQEWIILSPLEAGIQKKISKCAIPLKD